MKERVIPVHKNGGRGDCQIFSFTWKQQGPMLLNGLVCAVRAMTGA